MIFALVILEKRLLPVQMDVYQNMKNLVLIAYY